MSLKLKKKKKKKKTGHVLDFVPIGTVEVSIGTPDRLIQFLFSYAFWTLFSVFLSWELYLDVS